MSHSSPMYRLLLVFGALACTAVLAPLGAQAKESGLGGEAVPGVCMLSREAVLANARVSVAANARIEQMIDSGNAEFAAERQGVDADIAALRQEAAGLSEDVRKSRAASLSAQLQAIRAKAEHRSKEISLTRSKVFQQISDHLQPVIAAAYKAEGCGLLLDRSSVLGGNYSHDITASVVTGLDAKITTISFEREELPVS